MYKYSTQYAKHQKRAEATARGTAYRLHRSRHISGSNNKYQLAIIQATMHPKLANSSESINTQTHEIPLPPENILPSSYLNTKSCRTNPTPHTPSPHRMNTTNPRPIAVVQPESTSMGVGVTRLSPCFRARRLKSRPLSPLDRECRKSITN
jgi:hypothetical protein